MRALITGISGQDGSYLAELLLSKNYDVYGLARRNGGTLDNLKSVRDRIHFVYGDLRDTESLNVAIHKVWPAEIYNLGAQSFVPPSWDLPEETFDINTGGLARILSIVEKKKPDTKVYQASSSEMFGNQEVSLDEMCPLMPTSPYGISKSAAHRLVTAYRAKGLKCVAGILFNHESERRGVEMVTMKIARHVARFACGHKEALQLGNTRARRDWGHAEDYVRAMWMIMQKGDCDYVIGTGESYSVREFLDTALMVAGFDPVKWKEQWLRTDQNLQRDGEIDVLCAYPKRANEELGWRPEISFNQLVERMVNSEISKIKSAGR